MQTEYEVKILNINVEKTINKLEKLGARRVGEKYFRRHIYEFTPKKIILG